MRPDGTQRQRIYLLILGILAAIVGNTALAWVVHFLAFPLYLDSLFTFVVVRRWGLLSGVTVALATNGALSSLSLVLFPFVLCHLLTVLGTGLLFRRREVSLRLFLLAGALSALTNGLAGSFVSYFVFQGVTSVNPIDNLVLGLVFTGQSMFAAVFWAGIVTNLVDKLLSSAGAFYVDQGISPSFLAKAKSS